MPIAGGDYELVGATVGGSGPIRSPLHLEFNQGVTTFYGLNGAGKTRLLTMVSKGLSGVAPETDWLGNGPAIADIHLRFHDLEDSAPTGFHEQLVKSMSEYTNQKRDALATTAFLDHEFDTDLHEFVDRSPGTDLQASVARLVDILSGQRELTRPDFLYDVLQEGVFTARASGTEDRPAWDVFLAATPRMLRSLGMLEPSLAWAAALTISLHDQESDQTSDLIGTRPALDPLFGPSRVYWNWNLPGKRMPDPRWADWLPIPVLQVAADVSALPARLLAGSTPQGAVDGETLTAATTAAGPSGADERNHRHPPSIALLEDIQSRVEENLADVLVNPPRLRFHLRDEEAWLHGERPSWQFQVDDDLWLPIEHLSAAQSRWATLAIALAVAPRAAVPTVFVCDEPEAGLHRVAERRLARGLPELARRNGVGILTATHSPNLLETTLLNPTLVSRTRDRVEVRRVDLSLVDRVAAESSAAPLGLSVGDLLGLMRLAVIVEGVHDEWVFTALLRDDLDVAPAGVLPLHGGRNVKSLAEARLLFDATDADALVVLDNLASLDIQQRWSAASGAASQGDFDLARQHLGPLRDSKAAESLFVHQLGTRALEVGQLSRIHVHGLDMPDVICYLPSHAVLDGTSNWDEVLADWRASAGPDGPSNLKGWLKRKKLLPQDPEAIDRRVSAAAHEARADSLPIHPDLVRLGARIRELSVPST